MMLLFLLANGAPVPALMQFSAPVKKHWLGSFSIVLPPSVFAWVSGCAGPLGAGLRALRAQRGLSADGGGGRRARRALSGRRALRAGSPKLRGV